MSSEEDQIPTNLSKDSFELAYRRYNEDGGHSYDPYDIDVAWGHYKNTPNAYNYLKPFLPIG